MEGMRTKSFAEQVYSRVLSNGIQVYVFPRPGIGSVLTKIVVRTGSCCEGEFLGCGLSHFLEHMAFNGTENFPGESEIFDRVTKLGGETNACTALDRTQYFIDIAKEYAHEAMDMLTDMVARPTFPEDRFQKEKGIILREAAMYKDRVGTAVFQTLMEEIYHVAPIRVPVIGIPSKIEEVERDMMVRYYNMRYAPCRTGIIVVGDVDPVEIADYAEKKIGSWRAGRMDEPVQTPEPIQTSSRERTFYFANPMAMLDICWRMPILDQRTRAVAAVATNLIGNMESSCLPRKFILQEHLANDIGFCQIPVPSDMAIYGVYAECKPENLEKLQEGILAEMERLKREKIPQSEFQKVVKGVRRERSFLTTDNGSISNTLVDLFMKSQPLQVYDDFGELMLSVTPEDVQDFLQRCVVENQRTIVRQLPKEMEPKKVFDASELNVMEPPVVKTFPGGQRYIIMPDDTVETVNFSLHLPGGKRFESENESGYSALLRAVIGTGTEDYPEEELDDLLDIYNFGFKFHCGIRRFSVIADCLPEDFQVLMGLVTSLLTKPLLAEDKIARERSFLFDGMRKQENTSESLARLVSSQKLFCNDLAFCSDFKRTKESLSLATTEKLRAFMKKLFVAKDAVLSVGGAISESEAEAALQHLVDAIEWTETPLEEAKLTNILSESKTVTGSLPNKKQMIVRRDFILPIDVEKEHFVELNLANAVNSGMVSPVFQEVREKRGLSYHVGFQFGSSTQYLRGSYVAGTKAGEEEEVLALFEQNQREVAESGYTREQFENARKLVRLDFAKAFERPWEMANTCAVCEQTRSGTAGRFWKDRERLETITYEEFNETVKTWFDVPHAVSVIVSSEEKK